MKLLRKIMTNKKESNLYMELPKDPAILLSYINTQLRDFYPSLDEYCKTKGIEEKIITEPLSAIDYRYNPEQNRFM